MKIKYETYKPVGDGSGVEYFDGVITLEVTGLDETQTKSLDKLLRGTLADIQ